MLTNQDGRKEVANYIGLGFNSQQNANNAMIDFVLCLVKQHNFDKAEALEAAQIEYGDRANLDELSRVIDGQLLE